MVVRMIGIRCIGPDEVDKRQELDYGNAKPSEP
jgi:hypothetical protein